MTPDEFATISNFFSDAALLLTPEGVVLAANRQFCSLGFEPQHVIGQTLSEFSATPSEQVRSYLRDCCRNREPIVGSLTLSTPSGISVVCRCDGGVVHHDPERAGTQLLIKFATHDRSNIQYSVLNQKLAELTEEVRRRKHLQNELVAQQESLRVTLTSIGDGVIVCDATGTINFINPIAVGLTGWSEEQARGQPLAQVFHIVGEKTRDTAADPALRALKEGAVVGLANHTILIAKDGTERPIDDSAAPIRDRDGNVLGVVLVFRDVTEKRAAEIEQSRLAALVDSSEDAILGVTLEGTIIDWNAGAEQLFGFYAQEVVGRNTFDTIVPAECKEELVSALRKIGQGERLAPFETRRVCKDGRTIPVSVRISPILDSEGRVIGASAIDRDISRRYAAERRRSARFAVTQLLAHESNDKQTIREIVAAIGLALQWDAGCFWQFHPDDETLRCRDFWQRPEISLGEFRSATMRLAFKRGEGLPGRTWEAAQPLWATDLPSDSWFSRATEAGAAGLHQAVTFPVFLENELLGIFEWFCEPTSEPGDDLLETMEIIGRQIGQHFDRRQAMSNLRRSEQALQDFFENAAVGLQWVGPDGIILRVNRTGLDMLGYTRDEYVGHHISSFHADEDVIEDILQRLASGEQLRDCEARLRAKDGSIRHVLIDSNVLWEDGRFVHSRCFIRDITERKKAEEALQDSEERLRLAFDAGRMGSWEWHIPTETVIWSSTLEQIHGLPAGTFEGTFDAYQHDIHPEDREHVLNMIQRTVEEGKDHHLEYRIVWPDNSIHWLEARGKLFLDKFGEPLRLIGVCSDVTERKQLEQSLHFLAEASKVLSALVDYKSTLQRVASLAVPNFADWCAVDMLDAEGSVQRLAVAHVDPAKVQIAEELSRRYPPRADARHGSKKVLRTGVAELISDITDAMLEEAAQDDEHLRLLQELSPKSYVCVPLLSKQKVLGALTFANAESGRRYGPADLAMAEDLAHRASIAIENARLYQEQRDADRRKDEFLAMLAHELRNPLAPIRSGLDILAMEPGGQQETISLMQEQVEHVVRLVDDLLDVSRIMRGRVELRRQSIQLADIIRRCVQAVKPTVHNHQHELVVSLPKDPLYLNADPVRLIQILENLLNNASKYMDLGGRIDLIVERKGDQAAIIVQDQGVGIEPELLEHMFDLFRQSSRSLDRSQGGLGIGLTLVKRLTEMHGGTVSAHSEGPGHGSTFVVHLPIDEAPVTQPGAEQPQQQLTKGCRILVVDDNMGAARLLSMLLRKLDDYEVETAHDGPTALERTRATHPEIVFLDIGLPGMDGYQVATNIREDPAFDDVLLVALTGYGQEEDRRKSQEVGFDEHFVKPPSVEQMRQLLAHPKLKGKTGEN